MNTTTEAYIFVHFIGDEKTPTDEQLYFALSRDGVHWQDLRPAGKLNCAPEVGRGLLMVPD